MMRPLLLLVHVSLLASAGSALAQGAVESFDQQFQAARTLATSDQREAALRAYDALLSRSPGNADVLLGRGRLYAWMGKWPEAEADLGAVTASSPTYADAWSALGDMYLWSDRPAQAAKAYGEWLAQAPANDPAPLIARGRAFRAARDYPAARIDFEAAGARGADAGQIGAYLLSITPPGLNPRALAPDVVGPAGFPWSASLGADWTAFSPLRPDWYEYTLSVRRHFVRGSLAFEALGARRFNLDDHAWALDSYVDLWHRAYANLRYQRGPRADLFPGNAWRAEVFQGAGRGWELSGSYDRLAFSGAATDIYGVGVGKYVGNWYARWRHLYIPGSRSSSNSDRVLVRYYYAGDADNYAEFTAGIGSSNVSSSGLPVAAGGTHSWSTSAAFVRFINPRLGCKIGAGYDHEDRGYSGRSLFGTAYTRW